MSFSKEWDNIYKEKKQMAIWPFTDLVSYVMRYVRPYGHSFRVLELGCGAGANIPFFKQLGVQYYAVEGSNTIVNKLKEKFQDLKNNIICGDFTVDIPFQWKFDLVVDRASLAHNSTSSIKQCLKNIYNKLEVGGKFIGIDWFSITHSDYQKGKILPDDPFSKTGYNDGPFANIGVAHFSDKPHLIELFGKFDIIVLEHKIYKKEVPEDNSVLAFWNFVAVKK